MATVNRSRKQRGKRTIRFQNIAQNSRGRQTATNGSSEYDPVTGCDPNTVPEPPEPPEEPEPEEPPEEPVDPLAEEPLEEPEPRPNGCLPTDDAQWYRSAAPDSTGCPVGTVFLGFAEFPAGQFWVLCEGDNRPPGDGCPTPPRSWSCLSGNCVQVSNGTYASYEACINSGCQPTGYSCQGGSCVEVPLGEATYPTIEACQAQCSGSGAGGNNGYECIGGQCVPSPSGQYGSLEQCYASGCAGQTFLVTYSGGTGYPLNECAIDGGSSSPVALPSHSELRTANEFPFTVAPSVPGPGNIFTSCVNPLSQAFGLTTGWVTVSPSGTQAGGPCQPAGDPFNPAECTFIQFWTVTLPSVVSIIPIA